MADPYGNLMRQTSAATATLCECSRMHVSPLLMLLLYLCCLAVSAARPALLGTAVQQPRVQCFVSLGFSIPPLRSPPKEACARTPPPPPPYKRGTLGHSGSLICGGTLAGTPHDNNNLTYDKIRETGKPRTWGKKNTHTPPPPVSVALRLLPVPCVSYRGTFWRETKR